jgi:2'-hydroxyisoflavone reductase
VQSPGFFKWDSSLPAKEAGSPCDRMAINPVKPAPRSLRILILGGTGFTGPHQIRYALARGHKLTIFNRGRRQQEWSGEVEVLTGDRDTGDLKSLEGRDWDVCIDNPTSVPFWVRDAGQVLRGRIGHFVFISTISVYADASRPGREETAATAVYRGKDALAETRESLRADMSLYGPLKAFCELEAGRYFPGSTTVIRPGLIVGPGDETDRFTYWPVRLARGGEVLVPGDGSDPVQIIDARDLAEWTIRMAEQRTLGVFNATGPSEELCLAAMLNGISEVAKADVRLTQIGTDFLASQKVAPWTDLPVWVPGQGDTAGFARVSIARAVAAGLTFRPLATTVADTLAWFGSQSEDRRSKLRAGLSAEREAELLKAWHTRAIR